MRHECPVELGVGLRMIVLKDHLHPGCGKLFQAQVKASGGPLIKNIGV
jgi:hypothetical protein